MATMTTMMVATAAAVSSGLELFKFLVNPVLFRSLDALSRACVALDLAEEDLFLCVDQLFPLFSS